MTERINLDPEVVSFFNEMINHLNDIKQEALEKKDNPAYNKTVALRLNIEAFLKYFELRA